MGLPAVPNNWLFFSCDGKRVLVELKYMKKLNTSLIGLFQALGVVIYCALIVGIFNFFGKNFAGPAGFFGSILILVLLVVSAAVTGSIVFGYPAYLFLKHKRTKEALLILAHTLLYCLGIVIIALVLIAVLGFRI